jgi:uncharacterized protein YheU (UPF0270 family)
MEIPHRQLSPEALQGVLEEIVTRDGTEHTSVSQKVARLQGLLEAGKARLVFDEQTETCGVVEV